MKKNVAFFSLERQYKAHKAVFDNTIKKVLESQSFVGGPFVQDFENKFSSYVSADFAVSCNSGTDALWLALKALEIPQNGIVLTTPFSFTSKYDKESFK